MALGDICGIHVEGPTFFEEQPIHSALDQGWI